MRCDYVLRTVPVCDDLKYQFYVFKYSLHLHRIERIYDSFSYTVPVHKVRASRFPSIPNVTAILIHYVTDSIIINIIVIVVIAVMFTPQFKFILSQTVSSSASSTKLLLLPPASA